VAVVELIFPEAHHTIQLLKFPVIKASSIEGKLWLTWLSCWKFETIPISRYKGLKGCKTQPVLEGQWLERAFNVRCWRFL
jgi:hypothetical protein